LPAPKFPQAQALSLSIPKSLQEKPMVVPVMAKPSKPYPNKPLSIAKENSSLNCDKLLST
jgi:hypothetical protein